LDEEDIHPAEFVE